MKANVNLGALSIIVEASDYKELVKECWAIQRLNEAATLEGVDPHECFPYSEKDKDGNDRVGFVHMPTGRRVEFGQQKQGTGGHWFVRWKGSESYKGFISFGHMDPSNQLPEHSESPKRSNSPSAPGQKEAFKEIKAGMDEALENNDFHTLANLIDQAIEELPSFTGQWRKNLETQLRLKKKALNSMPLPH